MLRDEGNVQRDLALWRFASDEFVPGFSTLAHNVHGVPTRLVSTAQQLLQ
jgi:hypothetical protein